MQRIENVASLPLMPVLPLLWYYVIHNLGFETPVAGEDRIFLMKAFARNAVINVDARRPVLQTLS
jgi:hypothetical protein